MNQHKVTQARTQEELANAHASYWTAVEKRTQFYTGPHAAIRYLSTYIEFTGVMMIGMGLLKIGFLTAECSYSTYAWTAAISFLLSAPLYIFAILKLYASGFFFLDIEKWIYVPYFFLRDAGSIAIAAVVRLR